MGMPWSTGMPGSSGMPLSHQAITFDPAQSEQPQIPVRLLLDVMPRAPTQNVTPTGIHGNAHPDVASPGMAVSMQRQDPHTHVRIRALLL